MSRVVKDGNGTFDIYSRLLDDRIVMVQGEVDTEMANEVKAQLLYLDHIDNKKPIYMYVDSPGGCIVSGLGIVDTMRLVKSEVITIATGMAASMGSVILTAGDKSKATKNSVIMIHQPLMGLNFTQLENAKIRVAYCDRLYEMLLDIYEKKTGKSREQLRKDLDRDNFLSAQEALEYGLIDEVI